MNWINLVSSVYLSEIANPVKPKVLLVTTPGMWDMTSADLSTLRSIAQVDVLETKQITEIQLAKKCRGYTHLMLNMDPLPFPDPNRMEKLTEAFYSDPAVKGLRSLNVDMTDADFFSTKLAKRAGILLQTTPNAVTESVVESTITEILLHARGRHIAYTQNKTCEKLIDLKGKTAGVIGYGNIGKKVAAILQALGMRVLVNDINTAGIVSTPLKTIFSESTVITVHIPAIQKRTNISNTGLIEKNLLNLCSSTILVNLATDIIVDQTALLDAINTKKIVGYSVEPGREHTNKLKKIPEVHISPCSYDSAESRENVKSIWIQNTISTIRGTPQNTWN